MTIAQAFNEIAVAQGGTPSTSGTIAGAIDALNDALAGSDQASAQTIEDAVRLLGQNIGGGSSVTVEALTATENKTYTAPDGKAYSPVTVNVSGGGGDLSTANVKFVLTPPSGVTFTKIIVWNPWFNYPDSNNGYSSNAIATETDTATVILANGECYFESFGAEDSEGNRYFLGGEPTFSANVTYENGHFTITGDCTITAPMILGQ